MVWSRNDISLLKLSSFWGDTAAEIAAILGRDVEEIETMARKLGISLKLQFHRSPALQPDPYPSSGPPRI